MAIMLVLTRKLGEKIRIGDNIVVTVLEIQRGKVRIGIIADEIEVHREEVYRQVLEQRKVTHAKRAETGSSPTDAGGRPPAGGEPQAPGNRG